MGSLVLKQKYLIVASVKMIKSKWFDILYGNLKKKCIYTDSWKWASQDVSTGLRNDAF